MDKKKIVTWEAFKKYHEHLVGSIEDGDDLILCDEEKKVDEKDGQHK